jgi:thiol-disulfide isomerase/thioredoxin
MFWLVTRHSQLVTGEAMGMRIGTEIPSLDGATEWFGGTQAHAEAEAVGHPTLIHFWSISCGICKENMPRISEWRDGLRERGLRVVAVHMPRYESDTDVEGVREAIATNTITEPCAIDNEHKLKEAFQNDQGYVPAYYLFDGQGKLRSFAAGERGLDLLKSTLERVMAAVAQPAELTQTP